MLVPYARKNHNVSNFNPFHDFDELERAFFSDNALGEFKADIQEDGDNFVLEADLPGFKKEDIHVDVADDRLTVSAERHSNYEDKDKKGNYLRCERSYGSYARSFDISGIDAAGIKAAYADGVPARDAAEAEGSPRLVQTAGDRITDRSSTASRANSCPSAP